MTATRASTACPEPPRQSPIDFLDVAGSSCGALLPTGNVRDVVDGVELTCIDNGMPVVVMRARDFGKTGYESPEALEADAALKAKRRGDPPAIGPHDESRRRGEEDRAENVPGRAARSMAARSARAISFPIACTRPSACSAPSASPPPASPGSVAAEFAIVKSGATSQDLEVEHPTGFFTVDMEVTRDRRRARSSPLGAAAHGAQADGRRGLRAGKRRGRAHDGSARVCLIGFGEVGQILAADLAGQGATDAPTTSCFRSPTARQRARACASGSRAAPDAPSAARDADLVISAVTAAQITPPRAPCARAQARRVLPRSQFRFAGGKAGVARR